MLDLTCYEPLETDGYWPSTRYADYAELLAEGESGQLLCARHVMDVYFDSLCKFYECCAGTPGFPRIPKQGGDRSDADHAREVVHDYFAARAENLIVKWAHARAKRGASGPNHLRGFIKHDFRLHCRTLLRQHLAHHERRRESDLQDHEAASAERELLRHTTRLEVTALVRKAIARTLQTFPPASRYQYALLVENHLLHERRYAEFSDALDCELPAARKRLSRFVDRLLPILDALIREHGDSVADLRRDLG